MMMMSKHIDILVTRKDHTYTNKQTTSIQQRINSYTIKKKKSKKKKHKKQKQQYDEEKDKKKSDINYYGLFSN